MHEVRRFRLRVCISRSTTTIVRLPVNDHLLLGFGLLSEVPTASVRVPIHYLRQSLGQRQGQRERSRERDGPTCAGTCSAPLSRLIFTSTPWSHVAKKAGGKKVHLDLQVRSNKQTGHKCSLCPSQVVTHPGKEILTLQLGLCQFKRSRRCFHRSIKISLEYQNIFLIPHSILCHSPYYISIPVSPLLLPCIRDQTEGLFIPSFDGYTMPE